MALSRGFPLLRAESFIVGQAFSQYCGKQRWSIDSRNSLHTAWARSFE